LFLRPLFTSTAVFDFYAYLMHIDMHMRTTLIIDDDLLRRARELTGIQEKTSLVRAGLEALIAREAARRLAALGGTQPKVSSIPRRRSA
jgi:Arc/MetJ family transcription regulator